MNIFRKDYQQNPNFVDKNGAWNQKAEILGAATSAASPFIGGLISGGLSSKAGGAITNIGGTVGSAVGAVNPLLGAGISLGSAAIGGAVNKLWGAKVNQAHVNAVKDNIGNMNRYMSNAGDFDTLAGNMLSAPSAMAFNQSFLGKQGRFSNKISNMYKDLSAKQAAAQQHVFAENRNNAGNINMNQGLNALATSFAFGGPIGYPIGGALDYAMATDRLNQRNLEIQNNSIPNVFAYGGQKHKFNSAYGADWTNGITIVNAGGTHEQNPFGGTQMGVDSQGVPNQVEQGEVIYKDFVFSNRIQVPSEVREALGLKGKNVTFAGAAKQLQKESAERPNDPISKKGLDVSMSVLAQAQEQLKQAQMAMQQQVQQSEQPMMAQQPQLDEMQQMQQLQQLPQEVPAQALMGAYGGTLANKYALGTNGLFRRNYLKPFGIYTSNTTNGLLGPNNQGILGDYNIYDPQTTLSPAFDDAPDFSPLVKGQTKAGDYAIPQSIIPWDNYDMKQYPYQYKNPTLRQFVDTYGQMIGQVNPYLADALYNADGSTSIMPNSEDDSTRILRAKSQNYSPLQQLSNKQAVEQGMIDYDVTGMNNGPQYKKNWMTGLRYAPIVGSAYSVLSDLMGWSNKPDYSNADAIMEATRNIRDVSYNPIGDYFKPRKFDRLFYLNGLNAQLGAGIRGIQNGSTGNLGAANAAQVAMLNNAQNQYGQMARAAEELGLETDLKGAEFNKDTNKTNATLALEAQAANNSSASTKIQAAAQAAAIRDAIDQRVSAAKSLNLTNLFNNIGNLGIDALNRQDRDFLLWAGVYGGMPNWWSPYGMSKQNAEAMRAWQQYMQQQRREANNNNKTNK